MKKLNYMIKQFHFFTDMFQNEWWFEDHTDFIERNGISLLMFNLKNRWCVIQHYIDPDSGDHVQYCEIAYYPHC